MAVNYPVALEAATQADVKLVQVKAAISALQAGSLSPGVDVPVVLNSQVGNIQDKIKTIVDEAKDLLTIVKANVK